MDEVVIAVVGLGYVGLPLALAFGKRYKTIGYDICEDKVAAYRQYEDPAGEILESQFHESIKFSPTTDSAQLARADFIIVAVPTPVDDANIPDFRPLISASTLVGQNMSPGTMVIYESTVYPGATEELCRPILERESGLIWKEGFSLGYSPERINPGDRERTINDIIKVVSGDTKDTLNTVARLYSSIIEAGVFEASSIRVAEAAKVIENTQRDLNIALVNELAIIFNEIGIDTSDVLEAAGTKWNFLPFKPGLVGGHCIGVDPYYLTYKAQQEGYNPQVILAGRRINDGMAKYIAESTIRELIDLEVPIKNCDVTILGITFKENCSDLRNSKVLDIISSLADYGVNVHVYDPVACSSQANNQLGVRLVEWEQLPESHAVIAAVPHKQLLDIPIEELSKKLKRGGLYVDVKSTADRTLLKSRGFRVWRL
jgi:UDP-N-acetyl-D-galactosamine dehydrogenase